MISMNTTAGFMELGPEHRAPLHTRYDDMVEFDEQVNRPEDGPDESLHQEDMQQQEDIQEAIFFANTFLCPSHRGGSARKMRSYLPNRGYHNCARGFVALHSLPRLQLTNIRLCNHCGAKLFPHETNELCCLNGKVKLPELPVPPELMRLYTVQSEDGAHFRKHIHSYNHVLAFTSIGVRIDNELANSKKGVYTYRAQGTMYHKIGSLIPEPNNIPRFL
ncbi:hypothetical protein MKW94_014643 [Papaver nudicaule]|uniref:Uncharacterized protein n=1 Tax=Papaver nudicaule TaxID=74823 RepID=A0AA41RW00_PAPNU|nr:hypothetical protein [Papaver nudicaule]